MTTTRTLAHWIGGLLLAGGITGSVACAPLATGARRQHPLLGAEAGRGSPTSTTSWRSPVDDPLPDDGDDDRAVRARLAAAAASSIGDRPLVVGGVRYRMDCSGVAAGIYAKAGLRLDDGGGPSTRELYELVRRHGSLRRSRPLPGDLVFFDDTYDANGNGLRDDPLSHVGVVEAVRPDGVVLFVHRIGDRIVRWRLHPGRPGERVDDKGQTLNHYLRSADGPFPAQTTGELFVAFGSLPARLPAPTRRVAAR
jgi:peptidoglycan DL-endopeptidase CwlO